MKYDQDKEATIKAYLEDYLEMPCIAEQQKAKAPKPVGNFCSYLLGVPQKIGFDDVNHKSGDTYEYSGPRVIDLFITIYSETAFADASDLRNSFEMESTRTLFGLHHMSILRAFEIQDVSDLLETGYEIRAALTVQLSVREKYEENIGYIETVEISRN